MGSNGTPHIAQKVGRNIRAARLAAGLTQQQLGERIQATGGGRDVSRWENGGVEPGGKYRQALADELFNGDVAALYRDQEPVTA